VIEYKLFLLVGMFKFALKGGVFTIIS